MPFAIRLSGAVAALALLVAVPALAADIALSSKVDAVTVFPDGAMVTRAGEAILPAGEHVLILRNLPAGVDPASVRVEAKADQAVTLGTVESRAAPAGQPSGETAAKLKTLRGELAHAQARMDAAEAEKRAIERLTLASAEGAAREKGLDIAQARAAWTALGEATAAVNARLVAERAKAAETETEIKALEALDQRQRGQPANKLDLAIAIEAPREAKAAFSVTYRVRDARWLPVYDAQLVTIDKPKLTLIRRADIIQRTGE
ncbi:MAG: mucoidy inhibitor MuiA family protein, partial [Bosea sp. (in: a-proteobacteria)]